MPNEWGEYFHEYAHRIKEKKLFTLLLDLDTNGFYVFFHPKDGTYSLNPDAREAKMRQFAWFFHLPEDQVLIEGQRILEYPFGGWQLNERGDNLLVHVDQESIPQE